jgi:hypothetical protein
MWWIQIYPTTSTNQFVRFYLDTAEQKLKRIRTGSTNVEVIASFITNQLAFRAEDCRGVALTNDVNNRVIRMNLEFSQWQFPVASVGRGAYYDYYHLHTRISRRTIE